MLESPEQFLALALVNGKWIGYNSLVLFLFCIKKNMYMFTMRNY